MKRKTDKMLGMIAVLIMLTIVVSSCGSTISSLPAGNSTEFTSGDETLDLSDLSTTEMTTEALTTEELASEETTTEEITTEPEETVQNLVEMEVLLEAAKREVLTLYPGNGEGQIGYSDEGRGARAVGPESFAVEDGVIYVLDSINHRVIICKDGAYSYVDVSEYSLVRYMGYENGRIGVAGYLSDQVVAVYSIDGTREALIELEGVGGAVIVNRIVSIDDSSVEVECTDGTRYRYNWMTKKQENLGEVTGEISEDFGSRKVSILGRNEDITYYCYREGSNDVIGRELANIGRWYTIQDLLVYRTIPLKHLHVSEEGKLYLMECFEDRTVISELVLETK